MRLLYKYSYDKIHTTVPTTGKIVTQTELELCYDLVHLAGSVRERERHRANVLIGLTGVVTVLDVTQRPAY